MEARTVLISVMVMALVTYLPRVLPVTLFRRQIESKFVKDFLFYIPYTVLGAVTFPGIFYATGDLTTSLIGTLVALLIAFWKDSLIIVASGTIVVVYLLEVILH